MAASLREGVELVAAGEETPRVRDRALQVAHPAPPPVVAALRRKSELADAGAGVLEPRVAAWLAARYLLDDAPTRALVAAELARFPDEPSETVAPPVRIARGTRWRCHLRGACCQVVSPHPVYADERARILAHEGFFHEHYPEENPESFFLLEGTDPDGRETFSLRLDAGRCAFLGPDRACRIHRMLGPDVKPAVCHEFPLAVTRAPDGLRLWLRPSCESRAHALAPEHGDPLEAQTGWIERVLRGGTAGPRFGHLIRIEPERYWPFFFVQELCAHAARAARAAPSAIEVVRAAISPLVTALRALPTRPTLAELDRYLASVTGDDSAPPDGGTEAVEPSIPQAVETGPRGHADNPDPHRALVALRHVLLALHRGAARSTALRREAEPEAAFKLRSDALYLGGAAHLFASVGARTDWPPATGLAASAPSGDADPRDADPAVLRYARDVWVQSLHALAWATHPGGLRSGLGRLAIETLLARACARVRAATEGRTAATADDWNQGFAAVERTHLRIAFDIPLQAPLADALAIACPPSPAVWSP